MSIIRLQGEQEKKDGIYYEFDDCSTPLGEGGMGKVYRGRRINSRTNEMRDVAIKFMFAGLPPNVIQRAQDEANIRLLHDNLVEMMGFLAVENVLPNGTKTLRYHVVSELLIGVSLSDLIQGTVTDQTGVEIPYAKELYQLYNTSPDEFAVIVIKKVLSGIMALHDAGYIHRDIDPSNIMITRDGKIKLIDFGIAKKVDGLKTHDRNLTTAGQFMGKPQYAAPELILGDLKNQNKPTDIYAIGILFYQLLVGHLPFEGPSNVVLNAHLHSKIPASRIADKNLRRIVCKAANKNCLDRYRSAAEFRAELDSLSAGGKKSGLDNKIIYIIVGVVVAVAIAVGLWIVFRPEPGPKPDNQGEKPVAASVSSELTLNKVRKQLLNPSEAAEGLRSLQKFVDDGNVEAKFILSRLYAVSSGSFTLDGDYVNMQANLKNSIKQDPVKAHAMLKEVVAESPDYYPALYELACNYYEGAPLSGSEQRDLRQAKSLLDRAYKAAEKEDDAVYKNKISSLLRKY